MTRRSLYALPLVLGLLGGCSTVPPVAPVPGGGPISTAVSTVCTDLSKMPVAAVAMLDSQDPHSAIGVLWADARSFCANGVPTAGVSTGWGALVWGEVKTLIPVVLPQLFPLLVGLL